MAIAERHRRSGMRFEHTIQIDGTLLDGACCAFFKEPGFLVGLSLDGPAGAELPLRGLPALLQPHRPAHADHRRALRRGRPAAEVMAILAREAAELERRVAAVGRNDPCPCGSGRKLKHCHGKA